MDWYYYYYPFARSSLDKQQAKRVKNKNSNEQKVGAPTKEILFLGWMGRIRWRRTRANFLVYLQLLVLLLVSSFLCFSSPFLPPIGLCEDLLHFLGTTKLHSSLSLVPSHSFIRLFVHRQLVLLVGPFQYHFASTVWNAARPDPDYHALSGTTMIGSSSSSGGGRPATKNSSEQHNTVWEILTVIDE